MDFLDGLHGATAALAGLTGVFADVTTAPPTEVPFAVRLDPSASVNPTIHRDIDSLVAISDMIPSTGEISLFLRSGFQDTIQKRDFCTYSRNFGTETRLFQIRDVKNIMLARFGNSARFTVCSL